MAQAIETFYYNRVNGGFEDDFKIV